MLVLQQTQPRFSGTSTGGTTFVLMNVIIHYYVLVKKIHDDIPRLVLADKFMIQKVKYKLLKLSIFRNKKHLKKKMLGPYSLLRAAVTLPVTRCRVARQLYLQRRRRAMSTKAVDKLGINKEINLYTAFIVKSLATHWLVQRPMKANDLLSTISSQC